MSQHEVEVEDYFVTLNALLEWLILLGLFETVAIVECVDWSDVETSAHLIENVRKDIYLFL